MEKKQITPEIEGGIKSAMDELLGSWLGMRLPSFCEGLLKSKAKKSESVRIAECLPHSPAFPKQCRQLI